MKTTLALQSTIRLSNRLKRLHTKRRDGKDPNRDSRRQLTPKQRDVILNKTGKRCHICGDRIKGNDWQADHIFAHAHGGKHSIKNYLPAHSTCNRDRWHYTAEEFQWIIKLGVWARELIEERDSLGMALAEKFIKHERNRIARQRKS